MEDVALEVTLMLERVRIATMRPKVRVEYLKELAREIARAQEEPLTLRENNARQKAAELVSARLADLLK